MARTLYGASAADYAAQGLTGADPGAPVPGATLPVWSAITGGSQYTDLQDETTAAITVATADAQGGIRFYGPDGINIELWLDNGTKRYRIDPVDVATRTNTAQTTANTAITNAATAQTAADAATTVDDVSAIVGDALDNLTANPDAFPQYAQVAGSAFTAGTRLWVESFFPTAADGVQDGDLLFYTG